MPASFQKSINVRGRLLVFDKPVVMGILNATPDSFFASSRVQTDDAIAARTHAILDEGGTIIDVGGCSTRPGGDVCDAQTEMERVRHALRIVRREAPDAIVSVDTFRADVAKMAVEEFDADIINDVSEGADPQMFATVARLRRPYILQSVQPDLKGVMLSFAAKVQRLEDLGQNDIILDPGFGFGKDVDQNYALLSQMDSLQVFQRPLLVGMSRKRMARQLLGTDADHALNATTSLNTIALMKGTDIVRVHDVREAAECCAIVGKLLHARQ